MHFTKCQVYKMTLNTEERYYQTLDKDPKSNWDIRNPHKGGFNKEKYYIRLEFCFIVIYQKHSKAYDELHRIRVTREPF